MNSTTPTCCGLLLLILLGGCSTTPAGTGLLDFSELSAEIRVTRSVHDEAEAEAGVFAGR